MTKENSKNKVEVVHMTNRSEKERNKASSNMVTAKCGLGNAFSKYTDDWKMVTCNKCKHRK